MNDICTGETDTAVGALAPTPAQPHTFQARGRAVLSAHWAIQFAPSAPAYTLLRIDEIKAKVGHALALFLKSRVKRKDSGIQWRGWPPEQTRCRMPSGWHGRQAGRRMRITDTRINVGPRDASAQFLTFLSFDFSLPPITKPSHPENSTQGRACCTNAQFYVQLSRIAPLFVIPYVHICLRYLILALSKTR